LYSRFTGYVKMVFPVKHYARENGEVYMIVVRLQYAVVRLYYVFRITKFTLVRKRKN
jgi:hypothetical protein